MHIAHAAYRNKDAKRPPRVTGAPLRARHPSREECKGGHHPAVSSPCPPHPRPSSTDLRVPKFILVPRLPFSVSRTSLPHRIAEEKNVTQQDSQMIQIANHTAVSQFPSQLSRFSSFLKSPFSFHWLCQTAWSPNAGGESKSCFTGKG